MQDTLEAQDVSRRDYPWTERIMLLVALGALWTGVIDLASRHGASIAANLLGHKALHIHSATRSPETKRPTEATALPVEVRSEGIQPPSSAHMNAYDVVPCADEAAQRSHDSKRAVQLQLTNHASEPLQLWWLDYQSARKLYGVVAPGTLHTQGTFATHPWVVTTRSGTCRGILIAR